VRLLRVLLVIWIIAAAHFAAVLTVGVLSFVTQGDFDHPGPPSRTHRLVSATSDVLEFPFAWAVRRYSPERHRGFAAAAIATSVLWAMVLCAGWMRWSRSAQARA
jgi:hypothetical protein